MGSRNQNHNAILRAKQNRGSVKEGQYMDYPKQRLKTGGWKKKTPTRG
ncbi:MAG: hypothetical protein PHD46_04060 [Eubacteriales bacterium]|nr:hypothetical protein [Eubacteriales bacterium]MDD4422196.1 hypothetical protein [Eubacteriales bacterium]